MTKLVIIVQSDRGDKMAALAVSETAYKMVLEKQMELYQKYGTKVDMLRIASTSIIIGIDGVEEELGLIKETI